MNLPDRVILANRPERAASAQVRPLLLTCSVGCGWLIGRWHQQPGVGVGSGLVEGVGPRWAADGCCDVWIAGDGIPWMIWRFEGCSRGGDCGGRGWWGSRCSDEEG